MTHINRPRVRETSTTTGTIDFTLAGRMFGSVAFGSYMSNGDTCDYVASYGDTFEEGLGTYNSGVLQRTTVYRSRHANGTLDTNKVSFAAGVKTIIMTFGTPRVADMVVLQTKAVRADAVQSLSTGEKAQAQANIGFFPSGTKLVFVQAAAPVGWTKDTSNNDKTFRVVSGGSGGSTGGSVDFSTCFSRTTTDAFTLTQANLPNVNFAISGITLNDPGHGHGIVVPLSTTGALGTSAPIAFNNAFSGATNNATTGISVASQGTAASGGSGASKTAGMDIRVKYVDTIVCVKD